MTRCALLLVAVLAGGFVVHQRPALRLLGQPAQYTTLRAGDWVTVDLSWMPDYVTKRRGMQVCGQVIAINDVDCAWRVLLIEEVLPLPGES